VDHVVVPASEGKRVTVRDALGIVFKLRGSETGGLFSIVEHPLAPRGLGAPLHRHTNEDETSFVIEGHIGAKLGDDVVELGPGDYVFKPRNQWHTFWNPTDEPARFIEIITPAGFEAYFDELPSCFDGAVPDPARLTALAERFDLVTDQASVPALAHEHNLTL